MTLFFGLFLRVVAFGGCQAHPMRLAPETCDMLSRTESTLVNMSHYDDVGSQPGD